MDFSSIVLAQAAAHPAFSPQDAVKLSYQAVFGAEHLLLDPEGAKDWFDREYASVSPDDQPLFEPVSDHYARVNLGSWKAQGLDPDRLFALFYKTASTPSGKTDADLAAALDTVGALAEEGKLPFSHADWLAYRGEYTAKGGGTVHHSKGYREKERPAYRIVSMRLLRMLPVLKALQQIQKDGPVVIAIDGRAASGKSTLAAELAEVIGGSLIYMDDFFLPPVLRTPERLSEAGGNVHYERFIEEVLPNLGKETDFAYTAFDCSVMDYGEKQHVKASRYQIVEGSYSHHPKYGDYMDLRVFSSVDPEEQMRRILVRNGVQMAEMFKNRWIPMEEQYFNGYKIAEKADVLL